MYDSMGNALTNLMNVQRQNRAQPAAGGSAASVWDATRAATTAKNTPPPPQPPIENLQGPLDMGANKAQIMGQPDYQPNNMQGAQYNDYFNKLNGARVAPLEVKK